MDFGEFASGYLRELKAVLDEFDTDRFAQLVQALLDAYEKEHTIFIMGNGGSGSTASHFVCDLNKGCCLDLDKKFKVMCLNDNLPSLLAYANDLSYEAVFVEQLKNFFKQGDLVIGISGSGNSENVLQAIRHARAHGGKTAGISGYAGGKLADLVDIPFVARVDDMQKVEDVHMIIVHMIMQAVYAKLHPGAPGGKPC
jgi:D-sedoheptulose 7-phosphate isomerase